MDDGRVRELEQCKIFWIVDEGGEESEDDKGTVKDKL